MVGPCGCWSHAATAAASDQRRKPHQFPAAEAGRKPRSQQLPSSRAAGLQGHVGHQGCTRRLTGLRGLPPFQPVPILPLVNFLPNQLHRRQPDASRARRGWPGTARSARPALRFKCRAPTNRLPGSLLPDTHHSRAARNLPKEPQWKLFPVRFQSLAAAAHRPPPRLARRSHHGSASRCSNFKPTQHLVTFGELKC